MNADEQEIYDFLKGSGETFVSVNEISQKLGRGRRFDQDRTWARPILRRMEMDGLLESNPFGEYRVCTAPVMASNGLNFKEALKTPGAPLGDTTIIRLADVSN